MGQKSLQTGKKELLDVFCAYQEARELFKAFQNEKFSHITKLLFGHAERPLGCKGPFSIL